MNVFDMIGPIMVGPSSSHTAGALRIGRITRELLGEEPIEVEIKFHGSFAQTYKGHGTDKALIGGLMGMAPDDERIRKSIQLAGKIGLRFRFEAVSLKDAHPNTALICARSASGKEVVVQGSSIGGGNIVIKKINEMDVEFTGQYNTLIIAHKDTPGAIAAVVNVLAPNEINIASMKVYRCFKGGEAIMVIETDQEVVPELATLIEKLPKITHARLVKPI